MRQAAGPLSRNQAANDLAACPFGAMGLPDLWSSLRKDSMTRCNANQVAVSVRPERESYVSGVSGQWSVADWAFIVNALNHCYRLACFACAFYSAPRLLEECGKPIAGHRSALPNHFQRPQLAARSIFGTV